MTTTQILIAILSSSVLSAGLTSLVNYYLTKVNYKNEYYKKLLDKRLEAYELVYNLLAGLRTYIHDEDESTVTPYILTEGTQKLEAQIISLLLPIKNSIWLSSDLSTALTQLNVTLHNLLNEAMTHSNPDQALNRIGHEKLAEIRIIRKKIETCMKRDFKTLHNIQRFTT